MTKKKRPNAEPPPPISLSGRTVAGRYRIVGVIGRGGIGQVYEAEQIGLDRQVAVKVIRPERRGDAVTAARFLREARAAGRIASPNVVTLFDCGTDDGTGELYIAMEMLHGQSLAQRLASPDSMELLEALRTASAIARGLRAAHEAGVLHRDLKPANVFLCDDGMVKVLDFGIAKLIDEGAGVEERPLTRAHRVLGTPMYMSPEAATRRPLGPTADLYALGILIYEMLVGAPPFKTGDARKTLEAQVSAEAPRLTEAAPWRHIPWELDDLVVALLSKSPLDRPRDAGEVAEALERLTMQLAVSEPRLERATEVDVRLPPASDSDSPEDDESLESTTLWAGARARTSTVPSELGRPFPKEALEAYRSSLKEPKGRTLATLSPTQLAIAAVVAGGLVFSAALALRLIL